ncbi:MAG: P-II family nitrogen regulator [Clostridiales bacterium]|nr:P-II family nitrogen regulator [Clostridiales bacterium]
MNYELIVCIVNTGFTDVVMSAAKEVGARGGTVIHGRGTANKEAEEFFHISIQPDKEMVMILVTDDIKDAVLHAVYQNAGLKTAGQGIAFALPVTNVVGIAQSTPEEKKDEPPTAEPTAEQPAETPELKDETKNTEN